MLEYEYIYYILVLEYEYILLASSRAIGQRYSLRQIQKVSRYCLFVQPSAFAVDEKITKLYFTIREGPQ